MNEHNANLCLTILEEKLNGNDVGIREMVVNKQNPNGIYETYFFCFYHFATVNARDYLNRGQAYAKSGLAKAAITYFSQAIINDPSMGLAFWDRGILYMARGNYDKAIEDFTQAINLNMEAAFSLRGLAYKEAGDFDKARADFAKALELNPGDEMAKESLEEINKA